MPFELLRPSGLWLLGLLVPLVVLYILKVRRRRVRVSSTWLWAVARRDLLARSPFRRLIAEVPLLLQLLALGLLALALAAPATRAGAVIGDHLAVVVDTSASMGVTGADGKRRIDRARQAARRIVGALRPGSQAMIVEAGREPRVASPLDRDVRRLEAAIDGLDARDVEGRLGQAVALASDRLRGLGGDRRIIIVTDAAIADPDALASVALPVDVVRVGEPADNTAIVRVDVRSGVDAATRREQVQLFALVSHYGKQRRSVYVTLRQRNVTQPLASRRLELAPGERAPVVLTFEPTRGDQGSGLIVELSPNDALAVDDRAYARVPQGRRLPVVISPADGSPWLQRALLADPDLDVAGVGLDALAGAGVPDDALVVVSGACPPLTPGGDVLIVNPPPGPCRTALVAEPLEGAVPTSWSETDARFRFLTLDGVAIAKARRIETSGPEEALVRSREGTLIADVSMPGRTATLLGFEPGDSNWPLKASFVLFVRNVVELARAHRLHGVTGPAQTGQPISVRVPPAVEEVTLEGPDGRPSPLAARAGLVVVPELSRAGFYYLSWQGAQPGSALVTANLTSERESDVTPRALALAGGGVRAAASAELPAALSDWSWLLAALALGLIMLDAWWLTRVRRVPKGLRGGRPLAPDRAPGTA
jgi:hypothetical protein